jgi:hypothetical protein
VLTEGHTRSNRDAFGLLVRMNVCMYIYLVCQESARIKEGFTTPTLTRVVKPG